MWKFENFLGDFLGVPDGIQNISSGYAGLIGLVVVVSGWLVSARQAANKFRIENARSTLMVENEKFREEIKPVAPYFRAREEIPSHDALQADEESKKVSHSIFQILQLLEVLALDVATGRASEHYVIESQRSMICTISICSRTFINTARVARNERRLYHNLETLFIRLYFNRYAYLQYSIEKIIGRPAFSYSYLMFRLRYLIFCPLFGLDGDYRKEPWPKIKERFRVVRHFQQGVAFFLLVLVVCYLEFRFHLPI